MPSHLPRQRKVTFGCGSPARSFRFTVSSDVHEPSLPRALGTATTSVRRMRRFVHDGPLRLVSSILPRPFELVRTRPNRCRSTLHAASPHVSSFGEVLSARARPSPLILSRFVGVLSTRFRPRAPVQHAPLPSRPARPTSSLLPAAAEHASTPLRSHVACFGPSDRRSSCHVRAKTGVRRSRKTASPARNVQVRSKAAVCDVKRVKRDVEALESVAKCALRWNGAICVAGETDPPSSNARDRGEEEGLRFLEGWEGAKDTCVRGGGFQHQGSVVPFLRE